MCVFTTYVEEWLPDIMVESSTGTKHSVTGLSDINRTSTVQLVTSRELPLCCSIVTRHTALVSMIRVREIIKVNF